MRTATSLLAPIAAALALGGCALHYRAPVAGEPSALVRVKLDVDTAEAAKVVPPHHGLSTVVATVLVHEGGDTRVLATRSFPWSPVVDGRPLETIAVPVRAGEPADLEVRLAVRWTRVEYGPVTEQRPVSRGTVVTEPRWDPVSQSMGLATYTKVETKEESRTVNEWVKGERTAGCSARIALSPVDGATYLLDYRNARLSDGCTVAGFVERRGADGTVGLERI